MTAAALDLDRFELAPGLEADRPPRRRDQVRLLVAGPSGLRHARFSELGEFLEPGDLLVVNTSATRPAAVDAWRTGRTGRTVRGNASVTVHFAVALDDGDWVVEVRPRRHATGPIDDLRAGEVLALPGGALLTVSRPHPAGQARLWRASIALDSDPATYLAQVGHPIRYGYLARPVALREYQTVFARPDGHGGSAEMPSAARPFSPELVTDLVSRGVGVAPLVLHTGVSSPEAGEPPQPEWFSIPAATARLVNQARAAGGRIVAVGTTVTRALESAADEDAAVTARAGWTDLVLGPRRPARVVDGLVTGWHAPGASHLNLLQAVAGRDLVRRAYAEALRERYRWHEFGDSCLLLPSRSG